MESGKIEEWRGSIMSFAETLASAVQSPDETDLRTAIFGFWRQLASAPTTIQHQYTLIAEKEIRQTADAFEQTLSSRGFGLVVDSTDNDREVVRKVGGLLRSLELTFTREDLGSGPADLNEDWCVSWRGERAFLVPMARVAWREPKPEERDYRPFEQRGLVRTRIVPTEVDGARVRLYRSDHVTGKNASIAFGASLFQAVDFKETTSDKTFRITGFTAADLTDQISSACQGAHGCLAAVFPELTIDDISLEEIQHLLAYKPWLDAQAADPKTPAIVVAGSWHRPWQQGFSNAAPVLDGDGELLLTHRKRYAYRNEEGRAEEIIPGV